MSKSFLEEIFESYAVTYVRHPVVIDGTVVTAMGPAAAHAFGQAIAKGRSDLK